MATWDSIYKQKGIIQPQPLPAIKKLTCFIQDTGNNRTILDMGCGTGRHTFYLHQKFPDATIYAYDNSPKALELVNEIKEASSITDERIIIFEHDMDKEFPYQDIKFDIIVSTLVIHHGFFNEIQKRLDDSLTLLKDDGFFVLVVPSTKDPRYATGETAKDGTKLNTDQDDGDIPHFFFSNELIKKLFRDYSIIDIHEYERPMVTAVGAAVNWEIIVKK
ncbi:MAG: class I SAM-dependent methyltransferase [bacterium]|nr:class I SAM-dependent methyltransferase [bacterium]